MLLYNDKRAHADSVHYDPSCQDQLLALATVANARALAKSIKGGRLEPVTHVSTYESQSAGYQAQLVFINSLANAKPCWNAK